MNHHLQNNFGINFTIIFFDKTFLITNENSFNLSNILSTSFPPRGITKTFAVL